MGKCFDKVPRVLRRRRQWIVWKNETRNGDQTKLPYRSDGHGLASSTDSSTWSTMTDASRACGRMFMDGIGFVFTVDDDFVGVDLDGCRNPETGEFAEWARDAIRLLDSYTEISPSQTGAKVFIRGKSPFDSGKNVKLPNVPVVSEKEPGIEIYESGRYFAVTGLRVSGVSFDIEERTAQLADLCDRLIPKPKQPESAPVSGPTSDVVDRARKYVAKMPPAISGSGGHNTTFRVACVLMKGFVLSPEEGMMVLREWNGSCIPPWTEKELWHKITDAARASGQSGYLRDVEPSRWSSVAIPDHSATAGPPTIEATTLHSAATNYLNMIRDGKQPLLEIGLPDVDYALAGGVAAGEMVIMAGRPSHGKTAVALQVIHNATYNGHKCLLISEEMSSNQIGKRAIQFLSPVTEEHWRSSYENVSCDITEWFGRRTDCFIVENCRTAERAADEIRKAVSEHGVEMVVVDYAQLLSSPGAGRYEQITNTSVVLRQVTNETGIVLIALCQLNRAIENRSKYIPQMSDLRDTGQLEQDADVILFLVWPHRIDKDQPANLYQFFIAKNRNRAINCTAVTCQFRPMRQMFIEDRSTSNEVEIEQAQLEPGGWGE